MKLFSILFSGAFALSVAAAPADSTAAQASAFEAAMANYFEAEGPAEEALNLTKRAREGGVFYCEHMHWKGQCMYQRVVDGACNRMPAGWDNRISSFGPDYFDKNWACDLFEGPGCTGKSFWFKYPGTQNLEQSVYGLNDIVSSFRCSGKMRAQGATGGRP